MLLFFLFLLITYVYNKGEKDYPVTFAGLTKRDGSFIVSRDPIENFTLDNIQNLEIVGHMVNVVLEDNVIYVSIDGVKFKIDSNFNLTDAE